MTTENQQRIVRPLVLGHVLPARVSYIAIVEFRDDARCCTTVSTNSLVLSVSRLC